MAGGIPAPRRRTPASAAATGPGVMSTQTPTTQTRQIAPPPPMAAPTVATATAAQPRGYPTATPPPVIDRQGAPTAGGYGPGVPAAPRSPAANPYATPAQPAPPDWSTIATTLLGKDNPWASQVNALMSADLSNPQVAAIHQWLMDQTNGVNNTLAAGGMGNSSRAALETGALGAEAAGQLAGAQNTALGQLMSGELGSGNLNLGQQGLALQGNAAQFGQGQTLLGQENADFQNSLAGLGNLINWLMNTVGQTGSGGSVSG